MMNKITPDGLGNKPATKINVYTCPKGHETVFREMDEGTTPMMIDCRHEEDGKRCNQISKSAWYKCDQTLTPEFEFYKPGPNQKLTKAQKPYVRDGGLLIRRVGDTGQEKSKPAVAIQKIGRNDPCPCGKGKKFKLCCINNPLYKNLK